MFLEYSISMNEIYEKNRQKFLTLKELDLPISQFAITGSGALGVRNLREIGDIDIIVTSKLWNTLSKKYGIIEKNGLKKIIFPGELIEAFGPNSFQNKDKEDPTVIDRINQAEIIEGLPFELLDHVIYYKRKMGREKDLKDITLIEQWQKKQS